MTLAVTLRRCDALHSTGTCSHPTARACGAFPTMLPHAGAVRETVLIGDGLASQQHIVNRDGIAEFSCHNSTDASAGKLILLTSSGGRGLALASFVRCLAVRQAKYMRSPATLFAIQACGLQC